MSTPAKSDLRPIRVRIESDGQLGSSRVVDAETGRPIRCTSATLTMSVEGPSRLTIVLIDFEVEAQGAATTARKRSA